MMGSENEEDDVMFDQASLLTHQIKHYEGKNRLLKTLIICAAFLGLGLCISVLGPTLEDLEEKTDTGLSDISYLFSARAVGYLLGSIVGGVLLDHVNHLFLISAVLFVTGVATIISPWFKQLYLLAICISIQGIGMGFLDTGGNTYCLSLWGKDSSTYMQAVHFAFGVGAFLAPLLSEPFLSTTKLQNTTVTVIETTSVVVPSSSPIPSTSTQPAQARARRYAFRSAGEIDHSQSINATVTLTYVLSTTTKAFKPKKTGTLVSTNKKVADGTAEDIKSALKQAKNPPVVPPLKSQTKTPMQKKTEAVTSTDENHAPTESIYSGNNSTSVSVLKQEVSTIQAQVSTSSKMTEAPSTTSTQEMTSQNTGHVVFSTSQPSTTGPAVKEMPHLHKKPSKTGSSSKKNLSTADGRKLKEKLQDLNKQKTEEEEEEEKRNAADKLTSATTTIKSISTTSTVAPGLPTSKTTISSTSTTSRTTTTTVTSTTSAASTSHTTVPMTTTSASTLSPDLVELKEQINAFLENIDEATKNLTDKKTKDITEKMKSYLYDLQEKNSANPDQVKKFINKLKELTDRMSDKFTSEELNLYIKNVTNSLKSESTSVVQTILKYVTNVTRVQFVYLIIGLLLVLTSIISFFTHCCEKQDIRQKNQDIDGITTKKQSQSFRYKMMAGLFLFYMFNIGAEITFGGMLTSFASINLGWEKKDGVFLTAAFWGALTAARGGAICFTKCLTPFVMLILDLFLAFTSLFVMVLAVETHKWVMWTSTLVFGISMATIFPAGLSWAEKYIDITGKATSVIVVGASLGEFIMPPIVGYLIELQNPKHFWFLYINFAVVIGSCLVFFALYSIAKGQGEKYVLLRNRATADDETLEMSSLPGSFNTKKRVTFKMGSDTSKTRPALKRAGGGKQD